MSVQLSPELLVGVMIAGFLGALPIAVLVGLWDLGIWISKKRKELEQ